MDSSVSSSVKSQVLSLLEKGLVDSAEILASLLISSTLTSYPTSNDYSEALELFGDTIYAKHEYKRALDFYSQAFQQRKMALKSTQGRTIRQSIDSEV